MTIIQLRRGTAAEWTSANPVLNDGEQGLEKDTGKMKIGNGTSNWAALPYFVTGGAAYGDPTVVLNTGEALPVDIPDGAVVLRRSAAGGGGDHNSLQNLTVGNPHPQYIGGPSYSPGVSTYVHRSGYPNSAGYVTRNMVYFIPIPVAIGITYRTFGVRISLAGDAGSTIRLGLYSRSHTTGFPDALLADLGTVDSTTTGFKIITTAQVFADSIIYMAVVAQGGTLDPQMDATNNNGGFPGSQGLVWTSNWEAQGGIVQASVTGALPNLAASYLDGGWPYPVLYWAEG